MSDPVALVTGAGGEMGRRLIPALRSRGFDVVALDLQLPPKPVVDRCIEAIEASILDSDVMRKLVRKHRPVRVYHLAAVLSTKAEREPELAHRVNLEGTRGLFKICHEELEDADEPVRFLFPSSIAVYGLPDTRTKAAEGALRESEWTVPSGMYGCNKLYCELVGSYLSRPRAAETRPALDFRSIRFPGLISADTTPSGGTTDYAPQMIHAAVQAQPYTCFVAEGSRLPFMTMPDAVEAFLTLAEADARCLTTRVYNIRGFSASAGEIRDEVLRHFPEARIDFAPQPTRQGLVDSWPADVDDSRARDDWGFDPRHGWPEALGDYLIPALVERYQKAGTRRS